MNIDTIVQLTEARQGVYSDWHPPFVAFVWHYVEHIIPGPLGMLVLETGLIWVGTFLIALHWFTGKQATLFSLAPIALVFYPPVFSLTGRLDKDNLMWAFLMLAIGIAAVVEPISQVPRWRSYPNLALGASMLFLAMLVRHNAVFAAIPIMILCIARATRLGKPIYRITVSTTLALVICCCLQFATGLTTTLLASVKTNVWASIVIYDIAGIIYRMSDRHQQQFAYEQVPAGIRANGRLDGLLQTYSPIHYTTMVQNNYMGGVLQMNNLIDDSSQRLPFIMNGNSFQLTDMEANKLLHLWGSLIIQFPLEWVRHKIAVFKHVIGFDGQFLWSAVFMEPNSYGWATKMYGHPYSDLNSFQAFIKRSLTRVELRTPIYRPWIYLLLSLLITIVSLLQFSQERFDIACIAASGLANELGLFFLAPAPEYRYSHYMIYTSILSCLLLVYYFAKSRTNPDRDAARVDGC